MMQPKRQQARVIWQDTVHWSDDISPGEMKATSIDTYTTWGVILEDNSDYLLIASTIGFDDLVKEGTRIPKVLVKELYVIIDATSCKEVKSV